MSSSNVPLLPWYTWMDIIDYAVDNKNKELCKVSKSWYMRKASEFLLFVLPDRKDINKSINPVIWLKHPIKKIMFVRYTQIPWDIIKKCKNINTVEIAIRYGTKTFNYSEFCQNLCYLKIEHLEIDADEVFSSYCRDRRFIELFHLLLKSLRLLAFFEDLNEVNVFLGDLYFPLLNSFYFEGEAATVPFEKISENMPNLHSLKFKVTFNDTPFFVGEINLANLVELEIVDSLENDEDVFFKLALSKIPRVKKLTLLKNGNFECPEGYSTQVEELSLYSPKASLSNQFRGLFPKLQKVTIDCSEMESDDWKCLPQILGSATHLFLRGSLNIIDLKPVPLANQYVKRISLEYDFPLSDELFVWLSQSFKVEYLEILCNTLHLDKKFTHVSFPLLKVAFINDHLVDPDVFYKAFFN